MTDTTLFIFILGISNGFAWYWVFMSQRYLRASYKREEKLRDYCDVWAKINETQRQTIVNYEIQLTNRVSSFNPVRTVGKRYES